MRGVLAVVAPDAAQGGRARGAGRAQLAHDRIGERPAVVAGLLAAHDGELAPARRAGVRLRERDPVALAHAHPLDGARRLAQLGVERGERRGDPAGGADRDDQERHVPVGAGEAGAPAAAVGGAVDAEQDGRPGHAVLAQRGHERDVGRATAGAGAAAELHGQLHLLVLAGGRHARGGALERDQAAAGPRGGLGGGRADRLRPVDRHGDGRAGPPTTSAAGRCAGGGGRRSRPCRGAARRSAARAGRTRPSPCRRAGGRRRGRARRSRGSA